MSKVLVHRPLFVAIVGAEESAWTPEQRRAAKQFIRAVLSQKLRRRIVLVSGHCHRGGVDIWAEEIADKLGLHKRIFPAEKHRWHFYKKRNMQIAKLADKLFDVEPAGHRSGGSWTKKYMHDTLGKWAKTVHINPTSEQKELRELGFQLIGSSKDKAEMERVIQVEHDSGHKKKYHLIQGEKGLWYLYALTRNPLNKQEISELESLRDAFLEEMDDIDCTKPEELRRHYHLRGKVIAINDIIGTYDGKRQTQDEMGKNVPVNKNPLVHAKESDLNRMLNKEPEPEVDWDNAKYELDKLYKLRHRNKDLALVLLGKPTKDGYLEIVRAESYDRKVRGVGTLLFSKLVDLSKKRGYRGKLYVQASPFAVPFYKKIGMIKAGKFGSLAEFIFTPTAAARFQREAHRYLRGKINPSVEHFTVGPKRSLVNKIIKPVRKALIGREGLTGRTKKNPEGMFPVPSVKEFDMISVYYPLTGRTFKAKALDKPVETDGIWSVRIRDGTGNLASAVWNDSSGGWIYGEVKNPKFWRATTGYEHERGQTAGDVVRFEQDELGNDLGVTAKQLKELDSYPASQIKWFTKKKGHAARYGEPKSYDLKKFKVIAKDPDGGYLILILDKKNPARIIMNSRSREVVVSDIDDTIIDSRDRELNACRNSKSTLEWWAQYNNPANFKLDYPINSMWELLQKYAEEGKQIIYLSYRPEGLRGITQQQLIEFEFPPGELILCPTDDYLKKDPALFKLEWLKRIEKRKLKVIRVLEDNASIIQALNNAGYTTIAPGSVPMQPNPKRLRENSTKMQKLLVKNHPLQKLAAEWKDKRGWKDLNKAEAMALLKSTKAVQSLKMDGELECVAVDLRKGIKVGNRRYKCVIANKTTMSRKKEGGVWREEMRTGKIRTGGPICDEMVTLCRRGHIRRFIGFGELYGHKNGRRVPFGDTAHYISTTLPKLWKKHVRLALFDIYSINGKLYNRPYVKAMKLLRKKFSGIYVQTALFKYGSAITFRKVWKRWIETQGNEGLVITIGKKAYKVKPSLSVDGVIIALKKTGIRWKEKKLASAFKTAIMNKKGEFIEIADVGNGFSDIERAKLTKLIIKNKVGEDKDYIYTKPITVIEVAGMEKSKSRLPTIQVYNKQMRPIKKMTGWSIRMPRFIRYRTDKSPIYKDIRSEQLYSDGGVQSWSEKRIV